MFVPEKISNPCVQGEGGESVSIAYRLKGATEIEFDHSLFNLRGYEASGKQAAQKHQAYFFHFFPPGPQRFTFVPDSWSPKKSQEN